MSRVERPFVALGFGSVHASLEAEAVLNRAGVASLAIPAPRELGGLCGIALRVEAADASGAVAALEAAGSPPLATAAFTDF